MLYQGKKQYRSGYHALESLCEGKDPSDIAEYLIYNHKIWQGRSVAQGAARVRNCISPERTEHFSLGEVAAIMQYTHRGDILYYLCDFFSMTRPVPKDVEAQVAHIAGIAEQSAHNLESIMAMLENLKKVHANIDDDTVETKADFCFSINQHITDDF